MSNTKHILKTYWENFAIPAAVTVFCVGYLVFKSDQKMFNDKTKTILVSGILALDMATILISAADVNLRRELNVKKDIARITKSHLNSSATTKTLKQNSAAFENIVDAIFANLSDTEKKQLRKNIETKDAIFSNKKNGFKQRFSAVKKSTAYVDGVITKVLREHPEILEKAQQDLLAQRTYVSKPQQYTK